MNLQHFMLPRHCMIPSSPSASFVAPSARQRASRLRRALFFQPPLACSLQRQRHCSCGKTRRFGSCIQGAPRSCPHCFPVASLCLHVALTFSPLHERSFRILSCVNTHIHKHTHTLTAARPIKFSVKRLSTKAAIRLRSVHTPPIAPTRCRERCCREVAPHDLSHQSVASTPQAHMRSYFRGRWHSCCYNTFCSI